MAILRRALWSLGLVRVDVAPSMVNVAEGGTLPLTIAFRPKPPRTVSFAVNSDSPAVVCTEAVAIAVSESAQIETSLRGEHVGAGRLTVNVLPSARLGRGAQKMAWYLGAALGRGSAQATCTVVPSPIFVIAPHPDDEALIASGVIARALEQGKTVKVIIVTNGDHLRGKKAYGIKRQAESVAAMQKLGLQAADVIFLGYPGDVRGLLHIMNMYLDGESAYASAAGASATYGEHGLGKCDFHTWLTGKPASYNAVNLYGDMTTLIRAFRPHEIYTVSRFDEHPDHRAVNYLALRVLQRERQKDPDYAPILRTTIVHEPSLDAYQDFWDCDKPPPVISADFSADDLWPAPLEGDAAHDSKTVAKFTPPLQLARTSLTWNDVEKLPVPAAMQTAELDVNLKYQALQAYDTQPLRYLAPFCKQEEIFWRAEIPRQELLALSPLATMLRQDEARVVTVSLVNPALRRTAVALESSAPNIVAVPPAVIVEAGAVTASFALRALTQGHATVTAILGEPCLLMTVTVIDTVAGRREAVPMKSVRCA